MTAIPVSTFDLLVRDRDAAYAECAEAERATRLMPRFIGLGLASFLAYAAAMGLLHAVNPDPLGGAEDPIRFGARIFCAYAGAFFGTNIAALPTFYFHTLIAGVRTHGWRVSVEVMRAQATEATVMLGVLPAFLAAGIGASMMNLTLWADSAEAFGYLLPFVAGLPGSLGLLRTMRRLAAEAPDRPHSQRNATPTLLALAWCALFTVMAPVGVWGIWHML